MFKNFGLIFSKFEKKSLEHGFFDKVWHCSLNLMIMQKPLFEV